LSKEKTIFRKTEFLGTLKILQKIVFLRKNLWELLEARVLHIFEIRAKSLDPTHHPVPVFPS
jgi:hypothetical protein